MNKIKTLSIMLSLLFLTACGKGVETGDIAITSGVFSKKIDSEYKGPGWHLGPLTNFLIVDATEVRIEFENLTPKDANNIKFRDVDITVAFKINREKAVEFYKATKEVDSVKQNDGYTNVLGYKKMKNKLKSVIIKSFAKHPYQKFMRNREILENEIRILGQAAAEEIYPEAFVVGQVDTTTINLDEQVERALQDKAIISMKKKLILDREELMLKEVELQKKELETLKKVAQSAGISLESLLEYNVKREKNSVMSELAKSNSNIQVQVKD